jgi:hypothetical protein
MRGEAAYLSTEGPSYVEAGATRIIYPQDVRDAKNRIQAKFASVDTNVKACSALSSADASAWAAFYLAWRKFFCRDDVGSCSEPDVSIFGLGGQMDDCEVWEAQLFGWQQKLSKTCTLSAPLTAPPTPTGQQPEPITTALAWGAAIVGGILLLSVIDKTGLPRLWPKGKAR